MADSPAKAILDTSVYLPYLRKDLEIFDLGFLMRPTLLYMSSVVFAEIYTGARDRATALQLRKLYRTFERLNRLVTPDKQVWFEAAEVLQEFGTRYGFEEKGVARLSHDVLIALSARKIGAIVYTYNRKDFERIQAIKSFQLRAQDI